MTSQVQTVTSHTAPTTTALTKGSPTAKRQRASLDGKKRYTREEFLQNGNLIYSFMLFKMLDVSSDRTTRATYKLQADTEVIESVSVHEIYVQEVNLKRESGVLVQAEQTLHLRGRDTRLIVMTFEHSLRLFPFPRPRNYPPKLETKFSCNETAMDFRISLLRKFLTKWMTTANIQAKINPTNGNNKVHTNTHFLSH